MKRPTKAMKAAGGKPTAEKPKAGAHKPTGINKKMAKEKVPQKRPGVTYGDPTQSQKL